VQPSPDGCIQNPYVPAVTPATEFVADTLVLVYTISKHNGWPYFFVF
jgi:hypothetical protein